MKTKAAKAAPPAPARKRWLPWLGVVAALLCALAIYSPAINGAFVFDDITLPFATPGAADRPFRDWLGVRPLLMFSYWLNYRLSGLATFSYHFVNVILHAANAVLLFFIARKILEWASVDNPRRRILATFAAALFLCHPVATEAVTYIAGRSENLSVLLFFGAFAIFVYRRSPAISWRVSIFILILYAAAINTKEHTAVLPAALLLTDYYWNPGFSTAGIRRNWRLFLPMALTAIVGGLFLLRYLSAAPTVGFYIKDLSWHRYFFTECRALFLYFRLFLFPIGQNVDYDFPISATPLDHGAILALFGIVLLVVAAIYFRRRYTLASYGLLLSLILFAPTSSVVPIADPVAERRLYLPMIGLLLIALEFLRRARWRPNTSITVLSCICLAAAIMTYRRNGVWTNAIALEEDAAAKAPRNPRPHEALGLAYFLEGRCAEAVRQDEAAAQYEKPSYKLYLNWGVDLECDNRFDQALEILRRAAALQSTAHVNASIGKVLSRQHKWAEALASLETAAKIDPRFSWTYVYRGSVHQSLGDSAAAETDYRLALQCDPRNGNARDLLAEVEAQRKARGEHDAGTLQFR